MKPFAYLKEHPISLVLGIIITTATIVYAIIYNIQIVPKNERISLYEQSLEDRKADIQEKNSSIDKLEKRLERVDVLNDKLEEANQKIYDLYNKLSDKERELHDLKLEIKQYEDIITKKAVTFDQDVNKLNQKILSQNKEIANLKEKLNFYQDENVELKKELENKIILKRQFIKLNKPIQIFSGKVIFELKSNIKRDKATQQIIAKRVNDCDKVVAFLTLTEKEKNYICLKYNSRQSFAYKTEKYFIDVFDCAADGFELPSPGGLELGCELAIVKE